MYRLWAIIRKHNKIVRDMVASCDKETLSPNDCLHQCIHEICYEFDLQRPMWLTKNQREYEEFRRVVLTQDNFIESINFDALELEVLGD